MWCGGRRDTYVASEQQNKQGCGGTWEANGRCAKKPESLAGGRQGMTGLRVVVSVVDETKEKMGAEKKENEKPTC